MDYNVGVDGHVGGLGAIKHHEFAMASGEMSELEFTDFLTRTCRLMAMNSHPGALHYVCMDWRHAGELTTAVKQVYDEFNNIIVWDIRSFGQGILAEIFNLDRGISHNAAGFIIRRVYFHGSRLHRCYRRFLVII